MKRILNISPFTQNEVEAMLMDYSDILDPARMSKIVGYKVIINKVVDREDDVGMSVVATEEQFVSVSQWEDIKDDIEIVGDPSLFTYDDDDLSRFNNTIRSVEPVYEYAGPRLLLDVKVDFVRHNFPNLTDNELSKYDLIVTGIGDRGVNILSDIEYIEFNDDESRVLEDGIKKVYSQLDIIKRAHDLGISIIFTHDCLSLYDKVVDLDAYADLLKYLDIVEYDIPNNRDYYNVIERIDDTHDLLTAYYDLTSEEFTNLQIATTHFCRLQLGDSYDVLYRAADKQINNKSNYYLAVREVSGKGKIVFTTLGHNDKNNLFFNFPSLNDQKLFVNAVAWCLGMQQK